MLVTGFPGDHTNVFCACCILALVAASRWRAERARHGLFRDFHCLDALFLRRNFEHLEDLPSERGVSDDLLNKTVSKPILGKLALSVFTTG